MKIKSCLIIFSVLMTNVGLFGQYILEWSKTYPGEYPGYIKDIQITADGGYIMVGEFLSEKNDLGLFGPADLYVIKLDAEGDVEWEKKYGGSGVDIGHEIHQTKDGGYVICGVSNSKDGDVSENKGDGDAWILKLDNTGNIEWEKTFGGTNYDIFRSIKQTADGGYILAGGSRSDDGDIATNNGQSDVWILKLTSEGNFEWQKIYGGINPEGAYSIQITNDGGYVLCAHQESYTGSSDFWIIKLNSNGTIEWQETYGGTKEEFPYAIRQTNDGGFIVAGGTISQDGDISSSNGKYEFWIIKLDAQGAMEWERAYGGSEWEIARNIEQTSDGGYIIAGQSRSDDGDVKDNYGSWDAWIVKIDEIGNIEWQNNFGGSFADLANAIKENPDGSIIIAGESSSSDFDVNSINGFLNPWVFKLVPENSSSIINLFTNLSIGPNPSNGSITILVNEPSILFDVEVINVNGQVIYTKTQLQSQAQIDKLHSGQYFIKVISGTNRYIRKIIFN